MSILQKRISLIIAILITLLAGVLMFLYGINVRYTTNNATKVKNLFDEYYTELETIDEKLEAYVKYNESKYNKELVLDTTIKNDNDEDLYSIKIYQGISIDSRDSDGDGVYEDIEYLDYIYFIYNIQYTKVIENIGITGEDVDNTTLLFSVKVYNVEASTDEDFENDELTFYSSSTITLSSQTSYLEIVDTTSDKYVQDSEDEDYTDPYYLTGRIQVTATKAKNFKFCVLANPTVTDTDQEYEASRDVILIEEPTTIDKLEDYSSFEDGYNRDVKALGYVGFVIARRVWWQSLIAMAIMSIIAFSFYFAFTLEENTPTKAKKK